MKRLDRTIGLPSVIAISLSTMLGSGIFVLPGLAFTKTGPTVWLAYLLAGLCVAPAAFSKAELATAMPTSGGTYVYLARAFGPLAGTVSGLGLWLSLLLKSSFALVGFSAYLIVLAPDLPIQPMALALLVLVTLLNLSGVGKLSKVQITVASLSVVGLFVFAVYGRDQFNGSHFAAGLEHGTLGLIAAAAFVFVSYAGVTKVAALAGEVKSPEKNLPRGILLTLLIATVLYALVTASLVAVIPASELAGSLRPIHLLAERAGGATLGVVAAAMSIVVMTSMAAAGLLASSRFPFAMSRDRLVPVQLSRVSHRFRSPDVAILTTAAIMAIAILTLDVMKIAKLASAFTILAYAGVNAAVITLRESHVAWYRPSYRAPLYPYVQIFGVLSGVLMVVALGVLPILGASALVTVGVVLFYAYSRKRTEAMGVVDKIRSRRALSVSPERAEDARPTRLAQVVVALFGKEQSAETLVEVGAALSSNGRATFAARISEIDPGAIDELIEEEDAHTQSLRRRIDALADESASPILFDALTTHDLPLTVHTLTSRAQCEWLLMRWHGRPQGALTSLTPIGWLVNHLRTNLAMFKDAGIRRFRRILVLPAPGPHDALVVRAADHLARRWDAEVTLARFVFGDADPAMAEGEMAYLKELEKICDVNTEEVVLSGHNKIDTLAKHAAEHDLLVMAAPTFTLKNALWPPVEDVLTRRAPCSVLTLRRTATTTHFAHESAAQRSPKRSALLDFLSADAIGARVGVTAKAAMLSLIAERFAAALDVDTRTVHDALQQRENEQNTGVGDGVALPHGTLADTTRIILGVFVTADPIAYDALDNQPVDVFFATVGPPTERDAHLRLLADIARGTRDTDLLDKLRAAQDDDDILRALRATDRALRRAAEHTPEGPES